MKFAIIGGGVAAFEAANAIRARNADAEITLFSREAVPPYRRPALSGMVAETMEDDRFYLKNDAFYEERRITLRLGCAVTAVDRDAKQLTLAGGGRAAYDRLLLATGSRCFLPPVPGIGGANVLSLREFSDLEEIRRRLGGGARRVAVIGGGILGLELAESLLARGCAVTVIENSPTLLPRNLDPESAQAVLETVRKTPNLDLRFGATLCAVRPEGVELSGGVLLPADLVLVSAGTRANAALAAEAGLECGRGIRCDAFCRTADAAIFAAGDCAEIEGSLYGLYTAARTMGAVAGANMTGAEERFSLNAYPARIAVFGVKLFSAGKLEGAAETTGDPASGVFQKRFRSADGRLAGCVLAGDLRAAAALQKELDAAVL